MGKKKKAGFFLNNDHELQPLWLDYAHDVSGIMWVTSNEKEKDESFLRFVIDARAYGRLTQAALYALQLREQTQMVRKMTVKWLT